MAYEPSNSHELSGRMKRDTICSTGEMLAKFQRMYLRHNQILDIEDDLECILAFGPPEEGVDRPARTYLLVGDSGAGKSTILKRFWNQHAVVSEELRERMDVVYSEVPAAATRPGTMRAILTALGVGVSSRATEADLTRILVHHLRGMGVRVLILDEAQHLVDRETGRFAYATADWFKSLANSGIALVIAGLPEAALAYEHNVQLERRSMGSQRLRGFEWDGDDEGDWMTLLRGLVGRLPLADTSCLLTGDIPHRLHMVTGGYLGRLVDFLSLVIMEAGKRSLTGVSRELLMTVEERRRDVQNSDWLNVFALVSLDGYQPPLRDTSRRTRIRRGARRPRQQDIEHPEAA